MKNPNDKRVIKTRKLIIETFKEMIIEMDYNEITIKELADRANINRKTFYAHFECIEDILAELIELVSERFISNLESAGVFTTPTVEMCVKAIDLTLNENRDLYKKLIVANSYRFFLRSVKDTIKQTVYKLNLSNFVECNPVELDFISEFIASGLAKIYKMWLEDNKGISQERIGELAGRVCFYGFNSFIKK
ncbi:MAG: TetR/AcrR family transcriptional regulator [Clostridia bacterium]|nr:TetR/AcrR family transcriptional regulator [Clostridia bacterium]